MWALIPAWLRIGAALVVAATALACGSYHLGHQEGRQQAAAEALIKTVELFQTREKTNADITASDAFELCAHFGLSADDQRQCVRRLAEADTKTGQRAEDHHGR
jgi:hypothetical protein